MSVQNPISALEPEAVFEEGRALPFSQLGDWVNHAGISDRAARVYWTLCEHLNIKRADRAVWPAQSVLAKVLGIKRAADVAPAIDELVVIGAVEIRPDYDTSGRRVRNRYIIHRTPEEGYAGPRSLAEFYRLLRLDEGKQYEAWFAACRKEIADGVERLKRERQEADNRAKQEAKRRSLGGAGFRTATPPAKTRKAAAQVEVRDSSPRGAGSRTAGVRDPAPEQYVVEQHEDLSPPAAPNPTPQPPAPPEEDERENSATPSNDNDPATVAAAWTTARGARRNPAAERDVAASAGLLLAAGWPLPDVIALAEDMARRQPTYRDLTRHADHWQPARVVAAAVPELPDWCGHCDSADYRWLENATGYIRCKACNPQADGYRPAQAA